jgi:hypothetical protein
MSSIFRALWAFVRLVIVGPVVGVWLLYLLLFVKLEGAQLNAANFEGTEPMMISVRPEGGVYFTDTIVPARESARFNLGGFEGTVTVRILRWVPSLTSWIQYGEFTRTLTKDSILDAGVYQGAGYANVQSWTGSGSAGDGVSAPELTTEEQIQLFFAGAAFICPLLAVMLVIKYARRAANSVPD